MNTILNVKGYVDRRGPREQEAWRHIQQELNDRAIERRWQEAVRQNEGQRLLAKLRKA